MTAVTFEAAPAHMTHREVLEALSGLLLGMFVAILSSTVVTTALPKIISDFQRIARPNRGPRSERPAVNPRFVHVAQGGSGLRCGIAVVAGR
jgi:hypothetical protein